MQGLKLSELMDKYTYRCLLSGKNILVSVSKRYGTHGDYNIAEGYYYDNGYKTCTIRDNQLRDFYKDEF